MEKRASAEHEGKWALVTGASAGLGTEFARQLAARGYDLALAARRRDRLEALAAEVERDFKVKTVVVESDLSRPGASAALLAELDEKGIELDLLVNNAGVGMHGPAIDFPVEKVAALVQLNVNALMELALAAAKRMAARGSGAILNVSSTASFQPMPYFAVYAATKAFVTNFSLALARELAPRGVRVLAHCPGPTKTEFNAAGDVHAREAEWAYMSAGRCVAIGLRALDRRRSLVVTGLFNRVAAYFARRSPLWLVTRLVGWVMKPVKT
jgi:short-subunit dehydrogenase